MCARLIAAIGAGGKTTALRRLAQNAGARRVLFTTTTHIFPLEPPECRALLVDPSQEELLRELRQTGVVCAGRAAENGKLRALEEPLFSQAVDAAELTLCEADGANRRPLKLHRPDEPVLPAETELCLVVVGLSALGRPVGEVVHRYERNPAWAGDPQRPVGSEEFLCCVWENVRAAGLPACKLRVFLNQADTLSCQEQGQALVQAIRGRGLDCRLGSVGQEEKGFSRWLLDG